MIKATFVFLLSLAASAPLAAAEKTVKTTGGTISGVTNPDGSVTAFKGIPYATPPVGGLRWRAPQPAAAWNGVRKADHYGASCTQQPTSAFGPFTREFLYITPASEDCLYLNVWTPKAKAAAKLPVLVYIHGGGYDSGSGDVPIYEGEGLAKKGVVAVTINYRLGVIGFLVHPELSKESGKNASGNYGLLDQIAALKWVQANITAFGGDPNRVTIAGQSAGGGSVLSLIASPLARGLFHRAIVQSGGASAARGTGMPTGAGSANAEAAGQRFAESKGAKSIAELRAMRWDKVIEGTGMGAMFAAGRGTPGTTGAAVPFGRAGGGMPAMAAMAGRGGSPTAAPIVDGYVLPLSVTDAVSQGKFNDVPVLAGMNTGELGGIMAAPIGEVSLESFRNQARQRYGANADKFLALYPASNDQEAAAAQAQATRDQSLVGMYLWAKQRSKTSKTKVFQYLFDHALPGPDSARNGAFHTGEVPYTMNTLYTAPERPFTDADRKIGDILVSYWANFAAKGDPNGKGLPAWPSFGEKGVIMELGDKNEAIPVAGSSARLAFFEAYLTHP
ncbi:MAG: carboxylesterase family protein [Acidobacteria bacterium]|nr:carboxylesterase family protein [Acidobacteriota bacterium]